MTNSSASLCQRMVIGAGWMILWRLAVRIVSFLSDCGWIVPIRGNEMAELLRYLNTVLLVAAAVWYQRLGERRASQVFFARCRVVRNHFADRGIFVGDRRSRFAPLAAEFFDGVRLGHFMDTQPHPAAPTARPSSADFALSRPAAALDRLTSDPVG